MEYSHSSSKEKQSDKRRRDFLEAELQCVRKQNEALRFLLEAMSSKYSKLKTHLHLLPLQLQQNNHHLIHQVITSSASGFDDDDPTAQRQQQHLQFPVANKTTQFLIRTDPKDNTLTVKDGYEWRKYGQKVTKDNPSSPRAYFRCSMAPICPVKKKVQRCMHDKAILVATYEGHHTHNHNLGRMSTSSSSTLALPHPPQYCNQILQIDSPLVATNTLTASSSITVTSPPCLDLTLKSSEEENRAGGRDSEIDEKIQEYISSLTKDPNFKCYSCCPLH